MKWLNSKFENIILATGFLTKIPMIKKVNYTTSKLSEGLLFAPMIGLLIGGLLILVSIIGMQFFPDYLVAAILLVFYVYITGGLHIDGLGDLGDGLFSGKRDDAFYQVMKDSCLGTGGFLTILFVLSLDYLLLLELLDWKVLLLLPVAGRLGMLFGAIIGYYPSKYQGSGKQFIDGRNIKNSWWMLLLNLLFFYLVFNWQGILIFICLFILVFILVRIWSGKLGGITGDMLGALVEYSQVTFLFLLLLYRVV